MNHERFEKICVVGLGYIGLPTASLLATKGFSVCGVDINEKFVRMINEGKIPIYEPDLDILVRSAVKSGNLVAATAPQEADVFIIAVPTPFKENFQPDMKFVQAATDSIAEVLKPGNLVILESTSPVGSCEQIQKWIEEKRPDLNSENIFVVHCPERVLPGQILKELVDNDRIVGGVNAKATELAAQFYSKFVNGKILKTNARTAELTKLSENSFRDVNIAFANELSMICDKLEINVRELISLANCHPRVRILQPGPGVGGHCIAVDPWFIVSSAPEEARLIRTARMVNDSKPKFVVDKILKLAKRFHEPKIACFGLSYKANVDDLRESPAIQIVQMLKEKASDEILIVEPFIKELPEILKKSGKLKLTSIDSAIAAADIVVLLVDHKDFIAVERSRLNQKVVIDTRGIWS